MAEPERQRVGVDAAKLDVRFAGYCAYCDRIVERAEDGSCPEGHPPVAVTGKIALFDDDEVPALPRFNLAAFLIPFIWGPAHGQWVGAVFLPIWLFADSIVANAAAGGMVTRIAAVVVVAATVAFQAFFAKRANGLAFRRVCGRTSVGEFACAERLWALASVPAAGAIVAWVAYFDVVGRGATAR